MPIGRVSVQKGQETGIGKIMQATTEELQIAKQETIQTSTHSITQTSTESAIEKVSNGIVFTSLNPLTYNGPTCKQSQVSDVTIMPGRETVQGLLKGLSISQFEESIRGIVVSSMQQTAQDITLETTHASAELDTGNSIDRVSVKSSSQYSHEGYEGSEQAINVTSMAPGEETVQQRTSMGRTLTTEKIRESMEEGVRTSAQQDSRMSTQQDTLLSMQETSHTSTQRGTQTSVELEIEIPSGRTGLVEDLDEQDKRGVVDRQGSAQEYYQGSTQEATQESIERSTDQESDQQSAHRSYRRPSIPSLVVELRSASPTVAEQYTTATSPTSRKGPIKDAIVTLAETPTTNYFGRVRGRDRASTHDSVGEEEQGAYGSEGKNASLRAMEQTATEAAQKSTSSSRKIMQTTTESAQKHDSSSREIVQTEWSITDAEDEKSTAYDVVAQPSMEQTSAPVEINAQLVVSSSGATGLNNQFGEIVQDFAQGISDSLTTQTLPQLEIKDSTTTLTDSTGQHDSQGDIINITSLSGGEGVRGSAGGEIVRTQSLSESSMQETIHTSMQQTTQIFTQHNLEGSAELDIGTSTNRVMLTESPSQSEVLDVTSLHRESVREAVADETVRESMNEVSQSLALLTTQTKGVINAAVVTRGGNIVPDYVREPGRAEAGMRVLIEEQVHESEEEYSRIIGQTTIEAAQGKTQETVNGTTAEDVAIENIGVDATFSSSRATKIISQSSEISQDSL